VQASGGGGTDCLSRERFIKPFDIKVAIGGWCDNDDQPRSLGMAPVANVREKYFWVSVLHPIGLCFTSVRALVRAILNDEPTLVRLTFNGSSFRGSSQSSGKR
jgi:hypothetical protein